MNIDKFASKMDNLGVLAFVFVIVYAGLSLSKEISIMAVILLLVGIGGFLVDLFIVIKTRFKK